MSKSEEQWNGLQQWLLAELNVVYKNSIESLRVTSIGDTEGVYSYVGRVTLYLNNGEQEQLIAKIPTVEKYMDNRIRRNWTTGNADSYLDRLRELHNKEVLFYGNISDVLAVPKPVLLKGMENDEQGVIVMKCIPSACCLSICETFTEVQLKEIINGYVALQVAALNFKEEERRMLDTGLLEGILSTTLSAENIVKRLGIISNTFPALKNTLTELSAKFDITVATSLFNEEKARFKLFLHGDLHNTNILLQDGRYASFIDFQTIHYGNPCEDLIRLVCLGCESHQFLEMKNVVLHQYCVEAQKHSALDKMQISFEQIEESYNKMFPLCAMWALISLHAAYDHQVHGDPSSEGGNSEEKFVRKMNGIAKRILHYIDDLNLS